MKYRFAIIMVACCAASVEGQDMKVKLSPEIGSVTVTHNGKLVTIARSQDPANTVNPVYAKTSRNCPPFCIQPAVLAPGVETIGELELVDGQFEFH